METQSKISGDPILMLVHYEVREREKMKLKAVNRACQLIHMFHDKDDQSADPRDVTCRDCLSWLSLVVEDRRKKMTVKR